MMTILAKTNANLISGEKMLMIGNAMYEFYPFLINLLNSNFFLSI